MEKISTPFMFDAVHGSVVSMDKNEEIKTSVKTILMTTVHERLVSPTFGSRLQDYVFSMMEYTTLQMIKKEIMITLSEQEPRIQDIQVTFQHNHEQEGVLYVFVTYQILNGSESDGITLHMSKEGVSL